MYLESISIFFCFSILCTNCVNNGKYYIRSVERCQSTGRTFDPESPVSYNVSMLNDTMGRTYVAAHTTISKTTLPVNFNFRSYRLNKKGERVPELAIENVTCRNPATKSILYQLKIKYGAKDCVGFPGEYHMDKFHIDEVLRIFKYLFHGSESLIFDIEIDTARGLIVCIKATVESVH